MLPSLMGHERRKFHGEAGTQVVVQRFLAAHSGD